MMHLLVTQSDNHTHLTWEPVRYCLETDTMAIELRPWPGQPDETALAHDAGPDLVIHDYPGDGEAWLWEIEHASRHPEHIVAALSQLQRRQSGTTG